MPEILVIGATGNNGSVVVRELLKDKAQVRAFVRSGDKLKKILGKSDLSTLEIVEGDVGNTDALKKAINGVEQVFFALPFEEKSYHLSKKIIDLSKESGVRHVCRISAIGASSSSPFNISKEHGEIDDYGRNSGVTFTSFQPTFFLGNLVTMKASAIKNGVYPEGENPEAKKSWVDVEDNGIAIAKVLRTPSLQGKSYIFTGDAVENNELIKILSEETGKEIKFISSTPEENKKKLLTYGVPEWVAIRLEELNIVVNNGWSSEVDPSLKTILGREPVTVRSFIKKNAAAFKQHT